MALILEAPCGGGFSVPLRGGIEELKINGFKRKKGEMLFAMVRNAGCYLSEEGYISSSFYIVT